LGRGRMKAEIRGPKAEGNPKPETRILGPRQAMKSDAKLLKAIKSKNFRSGAESHAGGPRPYEPLGGCMNLYEVI
jgi:hypothetical protein